MSKWMPECSVCHRTKQPIGRSAPMEMANGLCNYECDGYRQDPQPTAHWNDEDAKDCASGCGEKL